MATTNGRASRSVNRSVPLPAELPSYVKQRDTMAIDAGLKIERAWGPQAWSPSSRPELISMYVGTMEQLVSSPFIVNKDEPKIPLNTRHGVKSTVLDPLTPDGHAVVFQARWRVARNSLVGAFRREDGCAYVKYLDIWPSSFGVLPGGTEYFVYPQLPCTPEGMTAVYWGTRDQLVADDVAAESQLPIPGIGSAGNKSEEIALPGGRFAGLTFPRSRTLWTSSSLPDGRVCFVKYSDVPDQVAIERERMARDGVAYLSAEDFRQEAQHSIDAGLHLFERRIAQLQAADVTYFFDPEVVARVQHLAREISNLLATAPVRSATNPFGAARATLPERSAAAAATVDPKFQRFLQGALTIPGAQATSARSDKER